MKLLLNARFYSFDTATGQFVPYDSLLLDDGRIAALDETPRGTGVELVDLNGAVVFPAFADCHVHLTDTGYFLGNRDLSRTRSYDDFVSAVEQIPAENGIVLGGQYDESTWRDRGVADAGPLERFHAGARALLSRIDGHSCIVNQRTLDWLDLPADVDGIERGAEGRPTGKLFTSANWRAQAAFMAQIPLATRRDAERRAVDLALSRGALHLHAQLVGFARDEYAREVDAMRALTAKIHSKIC